MTRVDIIPLLDPEMANAMQIEARENPPPDPPPEPGDIDGMRVVYNRGREYWRRGGPEMARIRNTTVDAEDGYDIPLRFYYPTEAETLPAIVYLHGGGWIVGNLDTHDRLMRELASRSGCCVVGVDYRLAPEAKFPVPMEDSVTAIRHLMVEGNAFGIDATRMGCAGDSAGGHMTLYAALQLRDRGVLPGFKAIAPLYMAVGLQDSQSWRMYQRPEEGMGMADRDVWLNALFDDPMRDRLHPGFDLLQNDLDNLPPAFVMACALDPVLDDSLAFAELLQAAGVPVWLRIHDGMLHSFIQYVEHMPKAGAAIQEVADFFAEKLV
ncbi:MAG: alpha/beta hydrolase fold domain-containing protein [Alphaproteobacteria bacterium]